MRKSINEEQNLTPSLDVLLQVKNSLADVIHRLLVAHSEMADSELEYRSVISEILLQSYVFRTHIISLIKEYEHNNFKELSKDDIELVSLIAEFCIEINDHDF